MGHALALGKRTQAEHEVRVSQAMLAQMLGTSRSQISAELQALEESRVIRRAYRRIYITDFEALCRLAGPNVQPL
jgi:CRP-like cAMP-binding protein